MDIILAYDNTEEIFRALAESFIVSLININDISVIPITGIQLTNIYVKTQLGINRDALLFVGYSHGLPDCLCSGDQNYYLKTPNDINLLENTFLYTFSCFSGKELGDSIGQTHGKTSAFIGYDAKIYFSYNYIHDFRCLVNSSIKKYLIDNFSVNEVYLSLIDDYNTLIFYYKYPDNHFDKLLHPNLIKNKNALILKGNKELRRH